MTTPEEVQARMRDRDREVRSARWVRLAECARDYCSPSAFGRLARRLRHQPASC